MSEVTIGIGPLRSTTVTKDALPIKVLEYMAASLPIIAQKDTLPYNVLCDGENGFFINNEEELATKIVYLLEDQKRSIQFGQKSREIVSNFDWKIITSKIIDEYEELKI